MTRSVQGYRLSHLHRDPIRGWRGRSSEDKFSILEHPKLPSLRATPPLPNQRQSGSPPPIRAEQWAGPGKRTRRGGGVAWPPRRRWVRLRCEAEELSDARRLFSNFQGPSQRTLVWNADAWVLPDGAWDPAGPDRTREICMLVGSGAPPRRRCPGWARRATEVRAEDPSAAGLPRPLCSPSRAPGPSGGTASFPYFPTGVRAETASPFPAPPRRRRVGGPDALRDAHVARAVGGDPKGDRRGSLWEEVGTAASPR